VIWLDFFPLWTLSTGILVNLESISGNMLSCPVARCWTITNDMPVFSGKFSKNLLIAPNPPAEAPIPAIGTARLGGVLRFSFFFAF
jgi:hypothetical protein